MTKPRLSLLYQSGPCTALRLSSAALAGLLFTLAIATTASAIEYESWQYMTPYPARDQLHDVWGTFGAMLDEALGTGLQSGWEKDIKGVLVTATRQHLAALDAWNKGG